MLLPFNDYVLSYCFCSTVNYVHNIEVTSLISLYNSKYVHVSIVLIFHLVLYLLFTCNHCFTTVANNSPMELEKIQALTKNSKKVSRKKLGLPLV
jgi:hypothetical protein